MGRRHAAEEPKPVRPDFPDEVPALGLGPLLREIEQWQAWNYGYDRDPTASALAVSEPVGVLASAVLMCVQGRKPEEWVRPAADAMGDIVVILGGLADLLNLDLEQCIRDRWDLLRACDFTEEVHSYRGPM